MRPTVLISAVLAALMAMNAPSSAAEATIDRQLLLRGLELYNENCAICHGENGDGKGPLASGLSPRPRDLTSGVFKFRTSEEGQFPVQADLVTLIRRGIAGSYGELMPRFDHLGDKDLIALAEVVRAAAGRPEFGTRVQPPPRPATADLARGEELYRELSCVDCHGENGDGQGEIAAELYDASGHRILPADLTVGQYKGGNQPTDLWMRLYNGIPGTPMPSFSRITSGEDLWAIVEYIQTFRKDGD